MAPRWVSRLLPQQTLNNLAYSVSKSHLLRICERKILTIAVELTNICNAKCSFCAYRMMKRAKTIMSDDVYDLALRRIAEYKKNIRLKYTPIVGDPLLDKGFASKIRRAKQVRNVKYIYTYTNLIRLDNFDVEELLTSGIDEIIISTCISDKAMYKRIYGVDAYDVVLKNIRNIIRVNNRLKKKVKIFVSLRVEKPNDVIRKNPDYLEILKLSEGRVSILTDDYDNWLGAIKQEDLPSGQKFRKKSEDSHEPCSLFYQGFIIMTDGSVNACWCRDFEASLKIGNIFENSINEMWTGKKLEELRTNWANGQVPPICRNCLLYNKRSDFLKTNCLRILKYNYL